MVSSRSVSPCVRAALALLVASFTPLAAHAAVITVPAGGDLQAALDAAAPGDTIVLEPGATFVGNFQLPVHGGTTYVTLRTGGDLSRLPAAGVRMTPAYAPTLAKLRSPNGIPALSTRAGAAYWRVMLLEFGPNRNGAGDVIALGSGTTAQSTLSVVPRHLILDRVYVHGDPVFGQKRGIALNSAETTIINSYVSDMKSTTQDTQAIAGWNGPGPFRIENNYLEAAGYPVMFGGDSPKISQLVPSDVTFRGNLVTRPVSWRAPLIATPAGVTTSPATGGSLVAGTYAYRVVARRPIGTTTATSARSAEVQATVGAGGKVTIRWTGVQGATEYRVYGRTAGGQTMYWTTTATSFTDIGAAGTAGTPPSTATVWLVKNLFELKNARNVQIDYNWFENHWQQAQPGPAILFTPRNSNSACAWCVVENVTFEYNVVRNIGAGFHILGIDPNPTAPSRQANNIRIRHNEISGLDKIKWGGTGYFLLMVNTPRDIQVDHNTIISPNGSGIVMMDHDPIENFVYTNNLARHNSNGIIGSGYGPGNPSIAAYLPNADIRRNVLAGGKASIYPADNYFPTVAEFESMFVDYASGDYRLKPNGNWAKAGTDGRDLGADYAMLPGQPDSNPGEQLRIVTATMPDTTEFEAYNTMLQASGGLAPYRWGLAAGSLPSGLMLSTSGQISGATTTAGDYTFTVQVTDAHNATAVQALQIHVEHAIPPVQIVTTTLPGATATLPYSATLTATGGLGSYTWSLVGGTLPSGVTLSSAGSLTGTPAAVGAYSFTVKAQDASAAARYSTRSFVLDVAKAPSQIPPSASDVVLYAKNATVGGGWTVSADATAAGGARLQNPNAGAAKLSVLASPTQYFEMTFNAEANVGYRLWMRGIATSNNWANDSVFVQFDQSVDAVGAAVNRIGTTSATTYTLEDCAGCGLSGWGWQDNGFGVGVLGPLVYFENSGVQRIRVQVREDGLGIDQIVLSPETFLTVAPGPTKNDATILAIPTVTTQTDVVLHTKNATTRPGWTLTSDATAASGARLQNANAGAAKISTALAAPTQYFDMTFNAQKGVGYRLWMRGIATSNNWANDSVFVQFDRSVDQNGVAVYRIGTTSATTYTLEDCAGCGMSGWGWQDNGFGTSVLGPLVYFAESGVQRIRVQVREDGLGIDQIVLSPSKYKATAPGTTKNDTTIVPTALPAARKELVLYTKNATALTGWTVTSDATAAGGARLQNANAGAAKAAGPLAAPTQYFDLTFEADAGMGYRLWMRGTAASNNWANDSVYVQFDKSVDQAGVPVYRIGTTTATAYTLEDCAGCGLSGWGWQDNGFGTGVLGPLVYFAQSGTQRIRVQVREDGLGLDQIVLSAEKYLLVAPGATKNDPTILPQ